MAAVTQRIDNYLGGVSRQSDDKKLPGQVRECLNGYPDPTFGLTKRPGFKWIANIGTGTTYDSAKWFYIHRDDDEKYIGCIKPASITVTGNVTSGATNKTKLATTASGSGTGLKVNLTASSGVVTAITVETAGANYVNNETITIASSDAGTGANVTGTLNVGDVDIWNAETGVACTITYTTGSQGYLTGARNDYDILTVQDTTIITNKLTVVSTEPDPTFITRTRATLQLYDTAITSTYSVTMNAGGGASDQTFSTTTDNNDTYDTLLTTLKNGIDAFGISGLTVTKFGASLELERVVSGTRTPFGITCKGGAANNKLTVFQDQVDNVSQIPLQSYQDHVVKIINTAGTSDTYFARFVADDGVSGTGYWAETIDPAKSPGLVDSSMPHELINTALNTFTFRKITWTDRLVGDDNTNSHPSFVGAKIQQSFFHSNRLGFLANDNVSMSQSGQFHNFYYTSAQTATDADPVDLSSSTIRPAALHGVVPTAQGLVLFSKSQQFLMRGVDGILTPSSATISTISNYEMDTNVDPVNMGNTLNFISKTPSYTRIFGMITRGQNENPEVVDVGRVVNEWVPATVDTFIASPQNQFLALSGQSSDKVYFYRTYSQGEQNIIEAWFNWEMMGNVQTIAVDQDDMYAVTKQANQFTISKGSLSQSPEDAIIVNNVGTKINPCIDLFATASYVGWDSTNEISKCYIPWNNVTGLTPVLIIKGSTASGTFVESGFTVTPSIGVESAWEASTAYAVGDTISNDGDKVYICDTAGTSAGSGGPTGTGTNITDGSARWDYVVTGSTYFSVKNKNLTSVASDVIVGWKYNFDVILPKTYFRSDDQKRITDFTASLTISRMKFAVGLSGLVAFKLKSTGVRQGKRDYIADGTTTVYQWDPSDLDYVDNDQIKVKINNVLSTDYTVDTTGTLPKITLNSASSELKTLSGNNSTTTFHLTYIPVNLTRVKVKIGDDIQDPSTYNIVEDYITFNTAPESGTNNILVYSADEISIYLDEWYSLNPISKADDYIANDISLQDQSIFTVPIHQKTDNFQLRIYNDSAFPVSLNSMMWEGHYSPRFYRRT